MQQEPIFTLYLYGKLGQLPHLENDQGYLAACKVMEKLGFDKIQIDKKTAKPYDEQWWDQFDVICGLTEEKMMEKLPFLVVDPSQKEMIQALMENRKEQIVEKETTARIGPSF